MLRTIKRKLHAKKKKKQGAVTVRTTTKHVKL